jgi:phosphopantothenoylcysteine decarboxylase/phosphopantothenate--cysteine ligase
MSRSDPSLLTATPKESAPKRVLFQLSGSIAAYKACHVISRLVQDGCEVQAAATRGALEFVGRATLEGLTGRPVFTDVYESGRMMDHIHLARWADVAILCPATAQTINRLATGTAEDPLGSLFLAWEIAGKPYFVAPAMNHQMLAHPATRASLGRLEEWGVRLLFGEEGHQACGEIGAGRLMEPDAILERLRGALGDAR